ncbi:hypothetical protein CAPTEDRAFT_195257 [Capitella teleta]|uniref:Uncharacterized protein n=1 Tax=Capitella teleta TaxID=283909 RepID=R7TPN1_CAPTE|nr:hypothetical protein CAPTEDRAFT_195257 [Capitella teleta]|eukprot:ELT95813.1 hypothetical protein CAPTEDRAFT_195257 [Capitella teleta]
MRRSVLLSHKSARSYSKSVSCINKRVRGCLNKPDFKNKFDRYKSTHKDGAIGQICINETLSSIYYRYADCYSQRYTAYSECTTDAIDWNKGLDTDPCEMLTAMRNCSDHVMSGPCGPEAVSIFSSTILKAEIPNTILMQKCTVVHSNGSHVVPMWLTVALFIVLNIMR